MECTKNIYLPGVGKKTLAGDEGTRVCPGHPLPVPQDHPCPMGPALPLALSRLLPPSGTSEALGLLRPHAALSTGSAGVRRAPFSLPPAPHLLCPFAVAVTPRVGISVC